MLPIKDNKVVCIHANTTLDRMTYPLISFQGGVLSENIGTTFMHMGFSGLYKHKSHEWNEIQYMIYGGSSTQ